VSWPWIVLVAIGICVVVAAEWPRVERALARTRERGTPDLRAVTPPEDDFVRSVQADLDALPTIEERESL
jgi:hypothetical protein